MIILLLSGWSGSGKDAVASLLVQNYQFQRLAFADILKEIVATEYGFPFEWAHTEAGKRQLLPNGKTVRELVIQRGQEIRAERGDPGFFARQIAKRIQQLPENQSIVISDWRFPVELETLEQELPGIPIIKIRIQRSNQESSPVQDAYTEHQLDDAIFDAHLQNPGTILHELKDALEKCLNNLRDHVALPACEMGTRLRNDL
jgi:adenylate kinase family enzyme